MTNEKHFWTCGIFVITGKPPGLQDCVPGVWGSRQHLSGAAWSTGRDYCKPPGPGPGFQGRDLAFRAVLTICPVLGKVRPAPRVLLDLLSLSGRRRPLLCSAPTAHCPASDLSTGTCMWVLVSQMWKGGFLSWNLERTDC